jgi:Reverse transcriptase (RNA-dependent DNA polymerase)
LRSSGKRWHERFADCLKEEGFFPCKTEPDIWMRPATDMSCYEMVAVYVDDLAFGMKDPRKFLENLETKHKFKLKGSGPISFHLGCDFERDQDGTLSMVPRQYIERMINQYERMFSCKPKLNVTSPLDKGDHPETDTSEFLDDAGQQQYQSLIGSLQWAITLGRIDVTTAVMTMSSFRAQPRVGHLSRVQRIVAYLHRYCNARIRFRTHEPDFSDLPVPTHDWADSTYGLVDEDIPKDLPSPLGKPVVTVSYVDANLMHDLTTGRSVTGILHFLNATPIDWYSKKMSTVETATYAAEFISARTCIEQLIDLRTTLRYLGVPMRERSYMFGDNQSVVNSAINPTSKLHKRHTVLSYHRVREAIASGKFVFTHISGENNPADILSKHWGASDVTHMLQLLFYKEGDTIGAPGKSNSVRIADVTVQTNSISKFSKHGNESIGGRVRGNTQIHSVEKFSCLATGRVCYGGHHLQGYRCSPKLGSISFSEGIMGSYPHTIPSCSEYFDSNDVASADSGQTFPKTEIGQTLSTNHKVGTQSRTYTSNESLGCSMSFQDNPRMPRIRMENTDHSDRGKEHLA